MKQYFVTRCGVTKYFTLNHNVLPLSCAQFCFRRPATTNKLLNMHTIVIVSQCDDGYPSNDVTFLAKYRKGYIPVDSIMYR